MKDFHSESSAETTGGCDDKKISGKSFKKNRYLKNYSIFLKCFLSNEEIFLKKLRDIKYR